MRVAEDRTRRRKIGKAMSICGLLQAYDDAVFMNNIGKICSYNSINVDDDEDEFKVLT